MHTKKLDLNLLLVANSLYQHKNVSSVAKELGLSQSAVSHALGRLRDHFQDPLFVRISRGVAPTEFAKSIQSEISAFVARAHSLSLLKESFDPKKAEGRVVISTTDYFEVVVMPKLLSQIRSEAPGLQISLRTTRGELPKKELENGQCDLAIAGFYHDLPEGFYRAKLFRDDFSVAMSKTHPLAKKKLTAKEYRELDHSHISLQGDFEDDLERKLVYGSASFTGPAWVTASTNLVLTAPTRLLKEYQRYFPIAVQPVPIPIDEIQLEMVWHELTHQDSLKRWFREKVRNFVN